MSSRKNPTTRQKLAAALLQLNRYRGGKWVPIIDYEEAKGMSADEIIARFELDHYPVSVKLGGSNHPTNLTWREREEHREKTNKIDAKIHKKARRFERSPGKVNRPWRLPVCEESEGEAEVQEPAVARRPPRKTKKIPSRPFPKRPKK